MAYFINLKKDIGKRKLLTPIMEKLGGQLYPGVDIRELDTATNIQLSWQIGFNCTRAAKQAKINLLSSLPPEIKYLILFEDDLILHKDFYENYKKVIEFADNTPNFKLIYLGVSSRLNLAESEFKIEYLPKDKRYAGAYGVLINRSIFPQIIYRSNDLALYNKPFDIYSLGYIQECYEDVYVCSPQIVLPDVTISNIRQSRNQSLIINNTGCNINDYIKPKRIMMFVYTYNNQEKMDRFMKIASSLIPYVRIIFSGCKSVVEKYITAGYEYTDEEINISDEIEGYYIVTDINVNWTDLDYSIFEFIETFIQKFDIIDFEVPICPRCKMNNTLSQIKRSKETKGFTVNKIKKISNSVFKTNNWGFYSVNECGEMSLNNFHTLTLDDFRQDIENDNSNDQLWKYMIEYFLENYAIRLWLCNKETIKNITNFTNISQKLFIDKKHLDYIYSTSQSQNIANYSLEVNLQNNKLTLGYNDLRKIEYDVI